MSSGHPFSPSVFEVGEDCRWQPAGLDGLRMNGHYIAGPAAGQERETWLRLVRDYRTRVRFPADLVPTIAMDYGGGAGAWVRLCARRLRRRTPCGRVIACEWRSMPDGVRETTRSASRSTCTTSVRTRSWAGRRCGRRFRSRRMGTGIGRRRSLTCLRSIRTRKWLRPILGMDATHDKTPGRMEIRAIELSLDGPGRMAAVGPGDFLATRGPRPARPAHL